MRPLSETPVRPMSNKQLKKCETPVRLPQIYKYVSPSFSTTPQQSQVSRPLKGETMRLCLQKTAFKMRLLDETYSIPGGANV